MKAKIKISPTVILMVAAALIFRDVSITKAAVILSAAFVHEMGHLAVALILKIPIKRITLDIFGASIKVECASCSYLKEAVLCIFGPLANIISVLLINSFFCSCDTRLFSIASLSFAIINLLPIKNFDGGRVLSCMMLSFISPKSVSIIINVLSFVCVFLLWSASVYFIMRTGSYVSLFIFSGALFAKLFLLNEDFEE